MASKTCKDCSVELIAGVNWSEGQSRNRVNRCRSCMSAKGSAWYAANSEKAKAAARERRKGSPESARIYRYEYYRRNKEKWQQYHKNWRTIRRLDPLRRAKLMCTWTCTRAKRRGIDFDLTPEFLAEKLRAGRCEVTGIEFAIECNEAGSKGVHPYAPSIDRISPKLGYVQSNVRMVVYMYNIVKSEYSDEQVMEFAKLLVASGEKL